MDEKPRITPKTANSVSGVELGFGNSFLIRIGFRFSYKTMFLSSLFTDLPLLGAMEHGLEIVHS